MDINIKEVSIQHLDEYAKIPMWLNVSSKLLVKRIDSGLGGILFDEVEVPKYIKDYSKHANPLEWVEKFDTSNWGFLIAYVGNTPIGAATLVYRTKGINMLSGRNDLCVLWDIRVSPDFKYQGVGSALFAYIKEWAIKRDCTQIKIETQNINIPACRFYKNQGAVLREYNEYAYYDEEDETQLIWYLDLNR